MDATGQITSSVEFFLCHITESLHWQLVGFSKNFWQQNLFMDDTRGYHVFPSQDFCITVSKIFTGNSPLFQKTSGSENKFWMRGGYHVSPTKIFLSHITKNFHCELFIFSEELSFIENFSWMGWRNQCFVEHFFVSHYRKNSRGTARCSRRILGAKIFMDERMGHHVSLSIIFLSHFFETFIGKSSVFQKNSGSDKFVWMREWDITFFRRKHFVSFYRKNLRGTLRRLGKILAVTIYYGWEGMSSFSVEVFLSHNFEKFLWNLFDVSKKFWQRNQFMDARGISRFFAEHFCLALTNFFSGNSSWFQKKMVSEEIYGQDRGHRNFP